MSDPYQLTVLYFGLLGERRGVAEERLSSAATTPRELYAVLDRDHRLGFSTEHFRVAVNDEFVTWDHVLKSGDTIAFLPPMSGG